MIALGELGNTLVALDLGRPLSFVFSVGPSSEQDTIGPTGDPRFERFERFNGTDFVLVGWREGDSAFMEMVKGARGRGETLVGELIMREEGSKVESRR